MPKTAAAIGDVLLGVLLGRRRRDAPVVVRDDHQARQLVARARAPDEARREVALGRPRVAALHDGDPAPAGALVGERRARRHRELHLDGRATRARRSSGAPSSGCRSSGPPSTGSVAVFFICRSVSIGSAPIASERGGRAVVQVQIVELGPLPLVDEEARASALSASSPGPPTQKKPSPCLFIRMRRSSRQRETSIRSWMRTRSSGASALSSPAGALEVVIVTVESLSACGASSEEGIAWCAASDLTFTASGGNGEARSRARRGGTHAARPLAGATSSPGRPVRGGAGSPVRRTG